MKKYILGLAALAAISVTACRKIETDGEPFVVEIPGTGGNGTTGKTVIIKGHVTKDTTLYAKDNNTISGFVYVDAGVTLTVEKGATVKGDYTSGEASTLIVKRGAKLMAVGTQEAPILFTSSSPNPASGDWGGIVLLGKASINSNNGGVAGSATKLYVPEGGFNNAAGDGLAGWGDAVAPAAIDNDNSGVLQYLRIEYAGNAYLPNQEINSLTMAAVGSGTTIDHIQVSYAKDDAFEWFGGTVNCKYLIAYKTQDDDFDTDNGFSGSVQFGLIIRDSTIADVSKSEAFESDNDANGSTLVPQTKAVFSNISAFGPLATLNNIGNSNYLGAGAQIRRNSSISIYNSVFAGWGTGILIDAGLGTPTDNNIADSVLRLKANVIVGCRKPIGYTVNGTATGTTEAGLTTWFTTSGNRVLATAPEVTFTRPFDYTNPDWNPTGTFSVSANNVPDFTDAVIVARTFITKVSFVGGLAAGGDNSAWHKGWTKFASN